LQSVLEVLSWHSHMVAFNQTDIFMNLRFSLAAATAALLLSPATMAQEAGAASGKSEASPVRLVSFDGGWQFLKTSSRLRIMRPAVDYTLTVDAAGEVTGCKLAHEFRRAYINERLCDVLVEHHTFEPAHDETGAAVEGSYSSRLVYVDLRENS